MVFYIHYSDGVANVFTNPKTLLGDWCRKEAAKIPMRRIFIEDSPKEVKKKKRFRYKNNASTHYGRMKK
jgi:hypothetical protein